MSRERWNLIEELFHQALDRPYAERAAYLAGACVGDDLIQSEVAALLQAEERRAEFGSALEATIASVTSSPDTDSDLEMMGRRIGAYRVTGLIGKGGMGVVYRAVRDDDEYRKEVAIKLLGQGLCGDYLQRRFRQERQILAQLEHPNIVRLLDGGATEDNRPYFVMEYVEAGIPLDRFCRERRPSIRERLRLFRQVCEAVDYAHRNLIVHRDLKPGHILVTHEEVPKLLDFGIAKVLNPDPHESPSDITVVRILTPEYASPEQIRGEPVTTASDVYSLGTILYELLTEVRPHSLEGRSFSEIERIISTAVPERPSNAAVRIAPLERHKRISRELWRDLDNIVLTALAKDNKQRYRSAGHLADDINRFLEGRPVVARRHTWRYRAAKFVLRHRMATCAAAIFALTLAAGLVAITYQARQIHRRSQQVRKLAQAVLFDFHDQIAALPGSTSTRLRLVQTALQYLDGLSREAEDDDSLQLDLAAAYERVSDAQGYPYEANLGLYREALESRGKALRIYEKLARDDPADAELSYKLAHSRMRMAGIEGFLGDSNSHRRSLQQAAKAAEQASNSHPVNPRNYVLLSSIQGQLGDAEMYATKPAAALSHYRAAIATGARWATARSGLQSKRFRASSLYQLSTALWDTGDYEGSFREMREAVRLSEECTRDAEATLVDRMSLLTYRNTLGSRLKDAAIFVGRPPIEAIEELQKARALAESLVTEDPNNAQARRNLVITYRRLALALQVSEPARAEELIRRALPLLPKAGGSDMQETTESLRNEAFTYSALAEILTRRFKHQEAVVALRTSIERQQRAVNLGSRRSDLQIDLHDLHAQLGTLLLKRGEWKWALEQFRRSVAISEPAFRSSPSANARKDVAKSYMNLARYWAAVGSLPEACHWRRKVLDIWIHWTDNAPAGAYSDAKQKEAQEALADCRTTIVRAAGEFPK